MIKVAALTVLITGTIGLALFLYVEFTRKTEVSKKEIKDERPTLDDLFSETNDGHIPTFEHTHSDEEEDNIEADENVPVIYSGLHRNKFLLQKDAGALYSRLCYLFAEQYNVSPRIWAMHVIKANERNKKLHDENVSNGLSFISRIVFDFVLTDFHSGDIKLVMMTEERIEQCGNREFLIGLLSHLNIPLYSYERLAEISDNDLSVDIAETIACGIFE